MNKKKQNKRLVQIYINKPEYRRKRDGTEISERPEKGN